MTEKKPLREQMAHSYKRQPAKQPARQPVNKPEVGKTSRQAPQQVSLHRTVTIPKADPSLAWNTFAQRQEQMRRARARPQRYVESVRPIASRTYAQTGMRATSGRVRAVQRSQFQQAPVSAVPTRSGRKRVRRGFFWRILSFFAVIVVVMLAAYFMFTSNAFRIEQVNVVGTHNTALINTIQRMGMQGQNIFLVNVEGLTERVDAYPLVASASLSKNWPNQLTVTVTERVPVLLWQARGGTYSVDSQGVVIAPLSETTGADHLMTVVDVRKNGTGQMLQPGMRLSQADIKFAVDILNHLPSAAGVAAFKLRYDVTLSGASYVVESPDGWLAYIGGAHDANPVDNRLIELQQILSLARQQQLNLATVDVRYGLHPVYTLKN